MLINMSLKRIDFSKKDQFFNSHDYRVDVSYAQKLSPIFHNMEITPLMLLCPEDAEISVRVQTHLPHIILGK